MNTQTIRDELFQFSHANFEAEEVDILNELTEIFIATQVSAIHSTVNVTTDGVILNLDLVIRFMEAKRERSNVYKTIVESVHSTLILYTVLPKRGGVHTTKCDLVFTNFEAFLQACLALKTKRHKIYSAFAAKCMSIIVRLNAAIRQDLQKTRAQLAEEKAQIQRRCFLVIKEAVREWRRENGYRYTDCQWRLKNFVACCNRIKGITYKVGATPFVQKEYLSNAHQAIKKFYGLCQRNPNGEQAHFEQTTMRNYYETL